MKTVKARDEHLRTRDESRRMMQSSSRLSRRAITRFLACAFGLLSVASVPSKEREAKGGREAQAARAPEEGEEDEEGDDVTREEEGEDAIRAAVHQATEERGSHPG